MGVSSNASLATLHTLQVLHEGVTYAATVQHYEPGHRFYIVSMRDVTHGQVLPINDIESEYIRHRESFGATILRSKWAARRRIRQYAKLWAAQSMMDTSSFG